MHELAFTQSVLDLANKHADGHQITDVYLVIGQLSSMVSDCVQFYWNMIAQGTPAEGSTLHVKRIPAQVCCSDCSGKSGLAEQFICPHCGSPNIRIVSGTECYVDMIEIHEEV